MDFNKKTYALITGASQGIGRTICLELANRLKNQPKFVVLGRDLKMLNETKTLILQINQDAKVFVSATDLFKPSLEEYKNIIKQSLIGDSVENYQSSIIFHNAGQLGSYKRSTELSDHSEWVNFYNLTLFSTALFTSAFIESFKNTAKTYIVNVSSYASRKAQIGLGMYCSGKAARDQYFAVVAAEEPELTVLNYSPGPVKTNIFNSVENAPSDVIVKNFLGSIQFVDVVKTVEKMLNILEEGSFQSGDFVDYFGRT